MLNIYIEFIYFKKKNNNKKINIKIKLKLKTNYRNNTWKKNIF